MTAMRSSPHRPPSRLARAALAGLIGAAAVPLTAGSAHAALFFAYAAGQTGYAAPAQSSLAVSIYLVERDTNGSTSLLAADGGLYSGGFVVTRDSAGLPPSPSGLTSITANNAAGPAAGFGGGNATVTQPSGPAGPARVDENVGNQTTGVAAVSIDATDESVLLGTVQVAVGAAGSTTTFDVAGIGTTLTNAGNALDAASTSPAYAAAAPGTFTVTAAPEPNMVVLGGLAACLGLVRRPGTRRHPQTPFAAG